jgi:hypothetical protein
MWYKKASIENIVDKISNELLINRIRRAFLKKYSRFPDHIELDSILKRIKGFVKKRHNSLYYMRKENLERKVLKLVDEILEEFNF